MAFRLESERLVLRPFRAADVDALHAYRNDPDVGRYQGWSAPTLEEARAFVQRQSELEPGEPGVRAQIAIESKRTGALLGDLFLDTSEDDQARVGFSLAHANQGEGLATEALTTLLSHLFETRGTHRVTALTLAANTRSIALLERVGMRREAHHVQSARFEGAWVDEFVYALLRDEWRGR